MFQLGAPALEARPQRGAVTVPEQVDDGQDIPVLKPGEVFEFTAADSLDGRVDINDAPFAGNAVAFLGTDLPVEDPLNSFVCARQRLSRATAEISRHNDFVVDGTWGMGTVVEGRVTGSVDIRGFLLLIGVGHAKAEVVAEVLDVTDPARPVVVNCVSLFKNQVKSVMQPSVQIDLKVEAGAPYIGGGFGFGTGNLVHFELARVRESVDFGFDVLLRRGHAYRLVVKCKSEGTINVGGLGLGAIPLGGKAIACFYDPANRPGDDQLFAPNLVQDFLDRLQQIGAFVNIPQSPALPNVLINLFPTNSNFPSVIQDLLGYLGMSIQRIGDDIVGVLNARFGLRIPHDPDVCSLVEAVFDFSDSQLFEEQIEHPGVAARRLCIGLSQDSIELAERQRIEDGLDKCRPLVPDLLPAAQGGQLEKVFQLVDERIRQAQAAGLSVEQARAKFDQAEHALARRDYRLAHQRLCQAYGHLLNG